MPECQRCGLGNPAPAVFCKRCHAPLAQGDASGLGRNVPTMPMIRVEQGGRDGMLPSLAPDNSRTQRLSPPRVPQFRIEEEETDSSDDMGAPTMMTPLHNNVSEPRIAHQAPPSPNTSHGIPNAAVAQQIRENKQSTEFQGIPQELELEMEDSPPPNTRFPSPPAYRAPQGVSVSFPSARQALQPPAQLPTGNIDLDDVGESTQTTPSPFSSPLPLPPLQKKLPRNAFETTEIPGSVADALAQIHGLSPATDDLNPTPAPPRVTGPPQPAHTQANIPPRPTAASSFASGDNFGDDDREDTVIASNAQRKAQRQRSQGQDTMHQLSSLDDGPGPTFGNKPPKVDTRKTLPGSDKLFKLAPPDAPLPSMGGTPSPQPIPPKINSFPPPALPSQPRPPSPPMTHTMDRADLRGMLVADDDDDDEFDDDDEESTRRMNPDQANEMRAQKDAMVVDESLLDEGDTLRARPFKEPILSELDPMPTQASPPLRSPASPNEPSPNRLVDRLIGQQFGNFRIEEKIGFGGFGSIYRATQLFLQQPIAVKVLHIDLQENTEVLARFRREAQALAQLRHDNIVQLSDFGLLPELGFYIAMEYLEGESIHNRLKEEEVFTLQRIRFIAEELCRVLGYVHQKGVIHRDMKPANIILYDDDVRGERLKLIDFGIAAIQSGPAMAITKVGSNLGTVRYMSPEQIMGSSTLDGRSDLYSVATILFRLLTAQLPFSATSDPMLLHQKTNNPAKKLSEVRPDKAWAPELVDLFQSALSKNPSERPDDANHFWQRAETAFEAQGTLENRQSGFDMGQAFSAPPPLSASQPVDLGPAFPEPFKPLPVPAPQKPRGAPFGGNPFEDSTLQDADDIRITSPPLDDLQKPSTGVHRWLIVLAILTMLSIGGGAWLLWQYLRG